MENPHTPPVSQPRGGPIKIIHLSFVLRLESPRKDTGPLYQFSSVQFIDSMQQLHHDRMIAQIRTWKRTKRHQSALTIALKLGLEKTFF